MTANILIILKGYRMAFIFSFNGKTQNHGIFSYTVTKHYRLENHIRF